MEQGKVLNPRFWQWMAISDLDHDFDRFSNISFWKHRISRELTKNTFCREFCINRHIKQLIHRGGEQIEFSGVCLEKSLWKVSGNQDFILLGVLLWLGRHNYSEYLNISKLFGFQSLEQVGMLGWGSDGWTLEVSRLGSFNLDDHWMERSQSSELFQNSFLIRRSLETKHPLLWNEKRQKASIWNFEIQPNWPFWSPGCSRWALWDGPKHNNG